MIGNNGNVTINVTAGVPARGLKRIVSNYYTCVSGPSVSASKLVGCVPTPSFPAKTCVCNLRNIESTCRANHNEVIVHTGIRVRANRARSGVIIARVPCNIGGRRLVRCVTRLIGRNGLRNVAGTGSRAKQRKVEVIVSIQHSTGTGIVLGGLFGVATLRDSFSIGSVTLIGNHPELLGLERYVGCFIRRHRRIAVQQAGCSGGGTRRETRLLRTLVATYSGVSRIIRLVHTDHAPRRTVAELVSHFTFSRIRTGCIISVHLSRLANLSVRRLRGRCSSLVTLVTRLRTVLSSPRVYGRIVGSRLLRIGRGCNSTQEAEVVPSRRRFGTRSFCPGGPIIVAVDRLNCIGHAPLDRCHRRLHNNIKTGTIGRESDSFTRLVFPTAVRRALVLFAGGNLYFKLGYCRLPRKDGSFGNQTVRGVLGVSASSGIRCILHLHPKIFSSSSFLDSRCIYFSAGANVIGGALLTGCIGLHTGKLETVGLSRDSRLISMQLAGKRGRLVVTAHCNFTTQFRRDGVHPVNHATTKIVNVHLRNRSSTLIKVVIIGGPRQRSIVIIDRGNCNGHSPIRSCSLHIGHNNGNIVAVGVARHAKYLITVGGIASTSSLVVVGGDNVTVHLTIASYHVIKEGARKIELVGLSGGNSAVTTIAGIVNTRQRTSTRRTSHLT